jgi:ELWxxDGT repeat protein
MFGLTWNQTVSRALTRVSDWYQGPQVSSHSRTLRRHLLWDNGRVLNPGDIMWLESRVLLAVDSVLLGDLDQTVSKLGFETQTPVSAGGILFFPSTSNEHGTELWRSDGTAAGTYMVSDIWAGPQSSGPRNLTSAGSFIYFTAAKDSTGRQLWRSDGTAAGTMVVKEFDLATPSSPIKELTMVGATLYFVTEDLTNGVELWKSNGTSATTMLVRNINPTGSSDPEELVSSNGLLFFSAFGNDGRELWRSDGTVTGTVRIKDIYPGTSIDYYGEIYPNSSSPRNLKEFNNAVYFSANDGTNGRELWRTDGTAAGTVLVRNIRLGTGSSSNPDYLTSVGGTLYFSANDGVFGTELWKTDGTFAGTQLVRNISASGNSLPSNLVRNGSTLYFIASNDVNGRELWKSDGTVNGTVLVKDIAPGLARSSIQEVTLVNSTIYFVADDGVNGSELWKTNGTAAGTVIVLDILPGATAGIPNSSQVGGLASLNGKLWFRGANIRGGMNLWTSNGTTAGTTPVARIGLQTTGIQADRAVNVGSAAYFTGVLSPGIDGLWKSDGTAAGTSLVRAFKRPDPYYPAIEEGSLIAAGGTLFFSAEDEANGFELWKSDGTEAGTIRVSNFSANVGTRKTEIAAIGNTVFFSASDQTTGFSLWKSDGTATGTVLVKDIAQGNPNFRPRYLTPFNGQLFFTSKDQTGNEGLWKSDGTSLGTVLVKDVSPSNNSSEIYQLTVSGSSLYFVANDGLNGSELWKSNGLTTGTVLVRDINPGAAGSNISHLTDASGVVYFSANANSAGRELWKSDGTVAGTTLVADIRTGVQSSYPGAVTVLNGFAYFVADDGNFGRELWRSNLTTGATNRVTDIAAGAVSSIPATKESLVKLGDWLYFGAAEGNDGAELWRTNGTITEQASDIAIGPFDSYPQVLGSLADRLIVSASRQLEGREVFAYRPSPVATLLTGSFLLPDGTGSLNLGATPFGVVSSSRTFTLQNNGNEPLVVQPATVGAGFAIESNFTAGQVILPGASATLSVRLSGSVAGTNSTHLVIPTNDLARNPYNITLSGFTLAANVAILDNGDVGYSDAGVWSSASTGYGNDRRLAAASNGTSTATWSFSNLTPGRYLVFATWNNPAPNRANNAPYTVSVSSGGTALLSVATNQQLAPTGLSENGTLWQSLGQVNLTATTLAVQLASATTGLVTADAIRVERIGNLVSIVDDGDAGFSITGSWSTAAAGYGNDRRLANPGPGTATATYQFTNLIPGQYRVSSTWISGANRANNIPVVVRATASGAALATFSVNQQVAPSSFVEGGFSFQHLGLVDSFGTSLIVQLANTTSGNINADAIHLERIGNPVAFVDDGDSGFTANSGFAALSSGYGNDRRLANAGNGTALATWTFAGLSAGRYRISATWNAGSNRANDLSYVVRETVAGVTVATLAANQRLAPAGPIVIDGVTFQVLGEGIITGNQLIIQLTNTLSGNVIADAIRIERLP